MQSICFLFNHDQAHQVAHSLPVALHLIKTGAAHVTLAVTNPALEDEIRRLAHDVADNLEIIRLQTNSVATQLIVRLLDGLIPAKKLLIYRDNLDFFRRYDALIVSEKSSLILKTRYGLNHLKIIHTRHGAGDRAIGFNSESAGFDLILVSGPKIRDRLVKEAGVPEQKIRITGYAKFDIATKDRKSLFSNSELPTILYNPHPSPHLSSWFRFGTRILEQFYQSDRYNLIFAPHVMLFARPWNVTIDRFSIAYTKKPPQRYFNAPNILMDLGSPLSTDMTYTNAADLYLGDVSSQVYEFLHRPRPCLFLNAHQDDWQGNPNYRHWTAGPVTSDPENILDAVDEAFSTQSSYKDIQNQLLSDSFSVTSDPASSRAARAIIEFLESNEDSA